ncbi:hypothetical protein WA026_017649 [Henosepilachna vigintioctopunctata]|uniref:Leucine-rich repeat-containing protein 20 n=1 Tax=Henosepilachna vigintioctopunctata TaxID=420089 RepID=A0AAW1UBF5_9CUCU
MATGVSRVIYRCEEAMETQQLDLSDCQLVHVAEAIYHLMRHTEVKSVNLSGNVITKISPKFVLKFNLITQLNLSHNQIANLPNEMVDLMLLTNLNISNNSFVDIPSCVFRIPNLQELLASNNRITDVDGESLKAAVSLESIDLTNNPLSRKCREELEQMKNIEITSSSKEEEDWEDLNV